MMQNLKKRRVLCISNVPAPYTVSFYNELGKKMDLTVLLSVFSPAIERQNGFVPKKIILKQYT